MDILIKASQLILSLTILVVVHEFGHFLFAKLFKTRVEKFYLFFNPWFSIFKIRKTDTGWKYKFFSSAKNSLEPTEIPNPLNPEEMIPAPVPKNTEWGIGWLPLGGYVKIAGMIDESMDTKQLQKTPEPWEFRSKKAWQRLLVMIGGVMFNFILAMVIFIGILFTWGEEFLPAKNVKYGIMCDSVALNIGLKNGDHIKALDDREIVDFKQIHKDLVLDKFHYIQITRNGKDTSISVPDDIQSTLIKNRDFVSVRIPFVAADFSSESPAKVAGIQVGDKLVGINGEELLFFDQYPPKLALLKSTEAMVSVERNGIKQDIKVTVTAEGKLGIFPQSELKAFFETEKKDYSIFESVPAGISKGYSAVGDYLKQFKLIFSPETGAYKEVGGFIAIGKIFPAFWDWQIFWTMTAILSIMLAVVNILPIPALDGGHTLFLLFEMITRRKPSDKFLEYAQMAGLVLLLGLVLFANGNDIVKLFK